MAAAHHGGHAAAYGDGATRPATAWVLDLVGPPASPAVRTLVAAGRLRGVDVKVTPAVDGSARARRSHPFGRVPSGRVAHSWDACEKSAWLSGLPALTAVLDACASGPGHRAHPRLDARGDADPARPALVAQWCDLLLTHVAPVVQEAVDTAHAAATSAAGVGALPLEDGAPLGLALPSCLRVLEQRLATERGLLSGVGQVGSSWVDLLLAFLLADVAAVPGGPAGLVQHCPRLAVWLAGHPLHPGAALDERSGAGPPGPPGQSGRGSTHAGQPRGRAVDSAAALVTQAREVRAWGCRAYCPSSAARARSCRLVISSCGRRIAPAGCVRWCCCRRSPS